MAIKVDIRRQVLERDNNTCQKCDKVHRKLQLHHIVPQRLDGSDLPHNLISLCAKCHHRWHCLESKLDIRMQEERTVSYFYIWVKEREIDVDVSLGDRWVWKEFRLIKKLFRQKKKSS